LRPRGGSVNNIRAQLPLIRHFDVTQDRSDDIVLKLCAIPLASVPTVSRRPAPAAGGFETGSLLLGCLPRQRVGDGVVAIRNRPSSLVCMIWLGCVTVSKPNGMRTSSIA
jgi:hypothetical protein